MTERIRRFLDGGQRLLNGNERCFFYPALGTLQQSSCGEIGSLKPFKDDI